MAVLGPTELNHELAGMDGWARGDVGIERTFENGDFAGSVNLLNEIAELAEQANHHPDISISWDRLTVVLVTHSEGGVTGADLELARQISRLR